MLIDGEEHILDLYQANYLNSNGISVPLNFEGGWRLWGNRTGCYPANTDPKDTFLSSRRFLAWWANIFILTYWQKVDRPLNRPFIESIIRSEEMRIESMVSTGALLGGRMQFSQEENPLTDLMDGIVKFHTYLGLVVPAEYIHNYIEFDPYYLQALFG